MPVDDEMRGNLGEAVQSLAADNARMCEILIAADKLHAAIIEYFSKKRFRRGLTADESKAFHEARAAKLADALAAYRITRNGT